ncbi:MAG TPA: HAD-IA family hydrolase [Euzebya sp.]|nr:HAD-IA family hydrolase [Euzebya sp.]
MTPDPTAGAVIFDCDGVLVDSEIIAIEVEVAALTAVGISLTPAGLAERYVGVSAAAQVAAVHEEFGVVLDEAWWAALAADSERALAQRVRAIPGIRAVVEGVPGPYALASSSSHPRIELCLRTAGLLDLFGDDVRFSATDVRRGKPAPDLFLHAASSLGIAANECVVVEDSPYGVRAALAAGMHVIGFTGGGHADQRWAARLRQAGAGLVVASAEELAAALGVGPAGPPHQPARRTRCR